MAKKNKQSGKGKKGESGEQDFRYRLRIAGFILDGNLDMVRALASIKGIGLQSAYGIVKSMEMDPKRKLGTLNDDEVSDLEEGLNNINQMLPAWMLNRKRDPYTGENLHLLGPDLDMSLREDISRLRKIKAYRGVRHSLGLPVRGQKTQTSFRKGTSMGVSRKARRQAKREAKQES